MPVFVFTEPEGPPNGVEDISRLGGSFVADQYAMTKASLRNTKITDEDLTCLKGLPSLQELDLSHTTVTNKGLVHLATCAKLTKLNLSFTNVNDHGLKHLQPLTKLKWLDLERQAKDEKHCFTDVGLNMLKHLKELEYVNLSCHHATEVGLTEFKKAMPKLKVVVSPAEMQIK
jgi:internalin A